MQSSMQSNACCSVPPVKVDDYQRQGKDITIEGMKTYVTGSSSAKYGFLVIYDIFGFSDQARQGCDILASGDSSQEHQVYMPDWFDGNKYDENDMPHKGRTDEENKESTEKLNKFFQGPAAFTKTLERIPKVLNAIKNENSNITTWGIIGLCWGGKVVNLASGKDTLFKAAVAAHPAMVNPEDAEKVTIPYLMLPSKDENAEDVKKWQQAIKVKHHVETFSDQVHGFMGARGDLKDAHVRKEFERAWKLVLNWFHDNLSA